MIRLLATPPASYRLEQIQAESLLSCNIVDDQIAGYWIEGTEPTQEEWQAIVSAHVPSEQEDVNEAANQALALMFLCIADNDMIGAQQAAQMWKEAVGL